MYDYKVSDSKYPFCTEAVIILKEGITEKDAIYTIDSKCGVSSNKFGDSIACVTEWSHKRKRNWQGLVVVL